MKYILQYKHAILLFLITQIFAIVDIFCKKKNLLKPFISSILLLIIGCGVTFFVNPQYSSFIIYGIITLCGLLLTLSSYISNKISGIIIMLLSLFVELLYTNSKITAWNLSIAILKSILTLGLMYFNNTENKNITTVTSYIPISILLIAQSVKSFIPVAKGAEVIKYSMCYWQQGIQLLGLGYMSYLTTSMIGNNIINHSSNNINLLLVFIASFGGLSGIISTRYILLILPILVVPILKIINVIAKFFNNDVSIISNIIAHLESKNTTSILLNIIISIISAAIYNISLYY